MARAEGWDDMRGSGGRGGGWLAADGIELGLQRHPVETGERQAEKDLDAVLEGREGLAKGGARSISLPSTAAGSGTPQCAVIGWPGQAGQASPAASSQTVKMKSICGAPACGELVPGLAAQALDGKRRPFSRSSE